MHVAEKPAQHQLDKEFDLLDTLSMVLFLLGGDPGTHDPITLTGRILRLVTFALGVGVVAVIIGNVASYVISQKKEARMDPDTEGHIVICNWNDRGDRIIKELHAPDAVPEVKIYVITDKETGEDKLRSASLAEYENVWFVSQDPTMHSVLRQQRAHRARSVIILMDEDCPDPDGRAALIALAISNLEREAGVLRKPHIVAEVANHRKAEHLKDAGVDEWVCANDFGLGILAQAALSHKITEVYQHLLSHAGDTNELYMIAPDDYPDLLIGMPFAEVAVRLNQSRDRRNPVLLLGVKRNDDVIMNPRPGELDRIEQGDALIVMAYSAPNLEFLTDPAAEPDSADA
jgi:voltage-gated potassium channel